MNKLFQLEDQELERYGAKATINEIKQQPELWKETLGIYLKEKDRIHQFLEGISSNGPVRVIFTGAGTSAYVGDILTAYLKNRVDETKFSIESIATTDMVSNPYDYLLKDVPTLLVSFARSGNSPESIAAVELGEQLVDQFYQLNITCAPNGQLAQRSKDKENAFLLLTPSKSNDQGFAMTGSFTCMMLSALFIFDSKTDEQKQQVVESIVEMGKQVVNEEDQIKAIVDKDFERIAYLGSGSLAGLTREAQLKVLELTAGQYATIYDSSMGFRHGPKSFVNNKTIVFVFTSNHPYTRQYDLDILEEFKREEITNLIVSISVQQETGYAGDTYTFQNGQELEDIYLSFPYIVFAQTVAVLLSIKVGNTPDTPSATGQVNRVVKGVTIHPYK